MSLHVLGLSVLKHLRWQDAVDVSLLTLLFSLAYRRIRRTVAVQVAFGIMTLLAASWLASHLGLILTAYLLSAIGAVATVVIVVVFQQEIRAGLSRVSPLRWFGGHPQGTVRGDARAIVAKAAFDLSERRKGALIVIPGRDAIFEHVTPGISIDGRLSVALIDAIFTAPSSLHDGAVVIGGGRVARAAVVLPLATESEDAGRGTRHRAAIGLARLTDALVVCVSEEQGTVCLAHDDELETMADENHLRNALADLGAGTELDHRPGNHVRRRGIWVLPHLAIFAVIVTAWAALALDRSHAVARVVALEIRGVTDRLVFDPPAYSSVVVELRSSSRELELLSPEAVGAFIDLAGTGPGFHSYRIHTSAPPGIEVVSVLPDNIPMLIRARTSPTGPAPILR